MPIESGIWRPHRWEDWEIELIDNSLDTVGLVDEAVGASIDWGIYGYGDGSLALNVKASVADDLLASGQWYFRFFRDGIQIRDFMLAKDDRGYTVVNQYVDEYIQITLSPLDMILKDKFGYPLGGGLASLTTPAVPIDDAMKWLVDHVCGPNAYAGPGASVRVMPGLTVAADLSAHPTSLAIDQANKVDLFDALQKYGTNWDVDWRVRLERTAGVANQFVFETFYPGRGVDKTVGNGARQPVIINDASGEISAARRYRPAVGFANVVFDKSLLTEYADAASIALYGRHEIISEFDDASSCATLLLERSQRIGVEMDVVESEMLEVGTTTDTEFEPGDEVTISNLHLAIPSEDDFIQSVRFTLRQQGQEAIQVTFGRYEKSLADNLKQGGGGGGVPKPPIWLGIKVGADVVPFTAFNPSYVELTNSDSSLTMVGTVATNIVDFANAWWARDVVGDPFLYPKIAGDDLHVGANITMDSSTGYVRATRFELGSATEYISDGTGDDINLVAADDILLSSGGALRWTVNQAGWIVPDGDNVNQIGTAAARVSSLYGYELDAKGDVTVGTAGKGLVMSDNTVNYFLMADGTRYIPHALAAADLPAHDILSATHGDTLASAVSRGSIIVGNATPKWAELTIGVVNTVLASDGNDAAWTDPSTLPVWGGYWSRAGTVLSPTTVGDYVYGVRFQVGSATEYISDGTGDDLDLVASDDILLSSGGALKWTVNQAGWFVPNGDNVNQVATAAARISTLYAYELDAKGDVTIGTAGKGIVASNNTAGYILMADGTRYVPHLPVWGDIPDHKHTYYKVIDWSAGGTLFDTSAVTGNVTGVTAGMAPDNNAAVVDSITYGAGTQLYIWTQAGSGGDWTGGAWKQMWTLTGVHYHGLRDKAGSGGASGGAEADGTAIFASHVHEVKVDGTVKTGSPAAP